MKFTDSIRKGGETHQPQDGLWPPSLSSCPLGKPAPTTPEAQLVISKEKRNWYQTTVPVFLPAFLVRNKLFIHKERADPLGAHLQSGDTSSVFLLPSHVFCSHGPNVHHSVLAVLQQAKLSYLSSFTYAELLTENNLLLGNSLPISLNCHLFFDLLFSACKMNLVTPVVPPTPFWAISAQVP